MTTATLGRWLSNVYDPTRMDARVNHVYVTDSTGRITLSSQEQQWRDHLARISEHAIGPPKATEKYTVAQLQVMGLVGLYAHPENP